MKRQTTLLLYFLFSGLIFTPAMRGQSGRENSFANEYMLHDVFAKLRNLETNKKGKINIVHIGDSHIQADIFTNTIRQTFQSRFGNGGWGFTFPYSLMRTNGTRTIKYISDATWQSQLNVYPVADVGVGLSGIALFTSSENFVIQMNVDEQYAFSKIKIVYPTEKPQYQISVTANPIETSVSTTTNTTGASSGGGGGAYHKVKSGETLSGIARKYKVTVAAIKKANGMKSNTLRAGKSLKIPGRGSKGSKGGKGSKATGRKVKSKVSKIKLNKDSISYVQLSNQPYSSTYVSDSLINRITILPNGKNPTCNLNGFVIQNNKPGIIYHTIGVNGAKLSDYTKYPLFFKQLPILEPDLVILSFGTNESFGKMSASEYVTQLREFVNRIKTHCGKEVAILVMTPPPSLFRRGRTNQYVVDYSNALMNMPKLPVWDLFSRMGGLASIRPQGENVSIIARDKVHYTTRGYQMQGEMFGDDFINAYINYKKQR